MKYLVRLSYLGLDFYGSQKQPGKRTLQGVFEEALTLCYSTFVKVTICSRLDRGVHAFDFALSFKTPNDKINKEHLLYYLRRSMEKDVLIHSLEEIEDDFSPRYDCSFKSYVYTIQNSSDYNPLYNPISYVPNKELDVDLLKQVLSLYEGNHDFRLFASPEGDENTILTIDKCELVQKDRFLYLRFIGKSFLRYQIRFLVGSALRVLDKKLSLEQIKEMLDGNPVSFPRLKAEPQGLTLEKICYPSLGDDENFPSGTPIFFH